MSELIEEVVRKRKELKEKIKSFREEVKEIFKDAVNGIFVKNPRLISFSWTQYTPYFNDGDTCRFRASTSYPSYTYLNAEGDELEYDENYGEGDGQNSNLKRQITSILCLFEDEELEDFFGDHVTVRVTRTGIETEDYDHE
jgi:hypothetical protein